MKSRPRKWNGSGRAEARRRRRQTIQQPHCRESWRKWSARKFSGLYGNRAATSLLRRESSESNVRRYMKKLAVLRSICNRKKYERITNRPLESKAPPDKALAAFECIASGSGGVPQP